MGPCVQVVGRVGLDVRKQQAPKHAQVVLVARGAPLVDLDGMRALGVPSPEATLVNALNAWALSVVACESFHADVHAGNLLVLTDGRVVERYEINNMPLLGISLPTERTGHGADRTRNRTRIYYTYQPSASFSK